MTNPITKDTRDFEDVVQDNLGVHDPLCSWVMKAELCDCGLTVRRNEILAAHNQAIEAAEREARIAEIERMRNNYMYEAEWYEVTTYLAGRLRVLQTPTNQEGKE